MFVLCYVQELIDSFLLHSCNWRTHLDCVCICHGLDISWSSQEDTNTQTPLPWHNAPGSPARSLCTFRCHTLWPIGGCGSESVRRKPRPDRPTLSPYSEKTHTQTIQHDKRDHLHPALANICLWAHGHTHTHTDLGSDTCYRYSVDGAVSIWFTCNNVLLFPIRVKATWSSWRQRYISVTMDQKTSEDKIYRGQGVAVRTQWPPRLSLFPLFKLFLNLVSLSTELFYIQLVTFICSGIFVWLFNDDNMINDFSCKFNFIVYEPKTVQIPDNMWLNIIELFITQVLYKWRSFSLLYLLY